jgi:dihydrofolate reductase
MRIDPEVRPVQTGRLPTQRERTAIMRLTTTTFVSVDGVMQGVGGPDEDRRDGFERGGWVVPYFDTETTKFVNEVYQRSDAFLFGRWTYETFASSWGQMADPGPNPRGWHRVWEALNMRPKYVASTTLTDPQWAGTTVLSSDLATSVAELKAKPGRELQVHGSRTLIQWLFDNNLVDEFNLLTFPVVVGQGTRLFPDSGPDRALELVESGATPSGVTIQVYRPTGRPEYRTATVDVDHATGDRSRKRDGK